jgi:hypothetical protein
MILNVGFIQISSEGERSGGSSRMGFRPTFFPEAVRVSSCDIFPDVGSVKGREML